jgi:hypothetical protein
MSDRAYLRIAENVDKGFQTAPKANGELSKAFIAYLKLVYTPEQAELVQHLPMPMNAKTAEEVAEASGRGLDDVEKILGPLAEKGFLTPSKRGYSLPAIPNLVNLHMFYPEMKPDDLEAAKLYQQFCRRGPRLHPGAGDRGSGAGPLPLPDPDREARHPRVQGCLPGRSLHLHRQDRRALRRARPGKAGHQGAGRRLSG